MRTLLGVTPVCKLAHRVNYGNDDDEKYANKIDNGELLVGH